MKNIYLVGFMGAGKSTIAKILSQKTGRPLLEMDACIEKQEGKPIRVIFEEDGEEYFRKKETEFLKNLSDEEAVIVSCGGGVCQRQENVDAMKAKGKVVLLTATPETILSRVKNSTTRPLLNGHMNTDYIASLMEKRQPSYEAAADVIIETDHKTKDQVCAEILSFPAQ